MKKMQLSVSRLDQGRAAFSLVEVAISLGLVAFALTGILGAIPLAAESSRRSITHSRVTSLASSLFANFRAQPFKAVQYVDAPISNGSGASSTTAATINLNNAATSEPGSGAQPGTDPSIRTTPLIIYAYFDEAPNATQATDERRVHFASSNPTLSSDTAGRLTGPIYEVVLRFNNNPAGTIKPYQLAYNGPLHAQASSIDAMIFDASYSPLGNNLEDVTRRHPKDVYHFTTVIANRLD